MSARSELLRLLREVPPGDAAMERDRLLMEFMASSLDRPMDRTQMPGHFTGSACVIHPDRRRVLLLLHTKLRRWLQPGGHADGDWDLAEVAIREVFEETGLCVSLVGPGAIDLDIHRVDPPAEAPHLHFDVRFAMLADEERVSGNHESLAHRWVLGSEPAIEGLDDGLLRLIARSMHVLGE